MRKVIAMLMAVVLMVAVAAPAAYAGDAAANAALGLAAFAVFSQFVMPLLTGQPAYAPAPVYSGPAYVPPPPPPVVYEQPRVYVEPAPAYPSYAPGYAYEHESHRPHGQWRYAPQSARPSHPWGWGRTGRMGPGLQSQ